MREIAGEMSADLEHERKEGTEKKILNHREHWDTEALRAGCGEDFSARASNSLREAERI
jgi:hypothetical protein